MTAIYEVAEAFIADLSLVQGQKYDIESIEWEHEGVPASMGGYRWIAEIRTKPGGALLLDIGEFFTMAEDFMSLELHIPASATRTLTRGGFWDLFLIEVLDPDNSFKLVKGAVALEKAVSLDDNVR